MKQNLRGSGSCSIVTQTEVGMSIPEENKDGYKGVAIRWFMASTSANDLVARQQRSARHKGMTCLLGGRGEHSNNP